MKKFIVFLSFFLLFLFPVPVFAQSAETGGKRIAIDLSKQTLYAFEGNNIVFQTAVSSGLPSTPTVRGTFSIQTKIPSQLMQGGSAYYGYYYLPNVPYVMYFYQSYAIHGTYWHNNFGYPMSHGCVNLSIPSAQWLYNWTSAGTPVQIY
ncbi:MAG: L,D-transpeptidase [Candidatus Levybacteria bacterium]|nr:L,D-transpeptidase [Candidatus Levybacteria bacterium]